MSGGREKLRARVNNERYVKVQAISVRSLTMRKESILTGQLLSNCIIVIGIDKVSVKMSNHQNDEALISVV